MKQVRKYLEIATVAIGLVRCSTAKLETRSEPNNLAQDEYAGLTVEEIAELEIKKNKVQATQTIIDEAKTKYGVLLTSDDVVCGMNGNSNFISYDALMKMYTSYFPNQKIDGKIVFGNGYVFTQDGRTFDLGLLINSKVWGNYDVLCQAVYLKENPVDITDRLERYDLDPKKALSKMIREKIRVKMGKE